MNIEKFKNYLQQKSQKSFLENIAFHALEDTAFMKEFIDLSFIKKISSLNNVLNNPQTYDIDNEEHQSLYNRLLKEISSAYTVYLYDKKGKYSELKSSIDEIKNKIIESENDLENIKKTSELISGARVLDQYSKEFETRAENYEAEAEKWRSKLYTSFIFLSIVLVAFIFCSFLDFDYIKKYLSEDIAYYGYIASILIKITILVGIVQLTRFFNRNYNANKHLASQSLHKYDVLRSLQGVYNTIDIENKDARDELIKTGALTAFQNIESGYITTKEGAGGSDASMFSIINEIFKK